MKSNPSSSPASRRRFAGVEPTLILLPLFIGFLRAAPFLPFFAMFLGNEFGLSNGLPAPNAWALGIVSAVGFWSVRILPRVLKNPHVLNGGFLVLGIALWIGWMALEPDWHIGEVLRDPNSLVNGRGQFGWVFVITFIFWILTLRLALDEREQSSEGVRGIMFRSLAIILGGVMVAAMVGSDMGDAGLAAGYIALPVALVCGIGAVGMSEMSATRASARRLGTTVPGWSRWGRTFTGTAIIVLIITFIAALMFGPGFLQLVIDLLATIWRGFTAVLLWVLYGLAYVVFWIIEAIAWLLNKFFGTDLQPPEMQPPPAGTPELQQQIETETEPGPWGSIIRFAGIGVLVLVGLALLARFARVRISNPESDADEERSSVFSGSLLKNQLKNLFRRKPHADKPRKLMLSSDPESVRESMLYLQTLAHRLGTPRLPHETPHDFTMRLGREWSGVRNDLEQINTRYERVRYGETEEDRAAVIQAWRNIWEDRKDIPGSKGD